MGVYCPKSSERDLTRLTGEIYVHHESYHNDLLVKFWQQRLPDLQPELHCALIKQAHAENGGDLCGKPNLADGHYQRRDES